MTENLRSEKGKGTMMQTIMKNWKIEAGTVEQIYGTAWNVDHKYILKKYDDQIKLDQSVLIMETLKEQNVPVAGIIKTADGKKYSEIDSQFYLLTEKLEGSHPADIRATGLAYRIGEIIGQLHLAFQKCENDLQLRDNSMLAEMKGWIQEELEKDNWQLIMKDDYDKILAELEEINPGLPRQPIHRDMHFGNFLFDEDRFTGYIDFDLSQKNIRIFDCCYFLAGQLTGEMGSQITDEEWLYAVNETLNGYGNVLPLVPGERRAAFLVMQGIELLFSAFFLKIGNRKLAEEGAAVAKRIAKVAEWVLP